MEDGGIREIENRGAVGRLDGTADQPLSPEIVGDNDVTGEIGADFFRPGQQPEFPGSGAAAKFSKIKLRENVVDVEDHGSPAQAGQKRAENQEVRNRMNVNEIVSLFQVVYGNVGKSAQEKSTNAPGVGDRALLVNQPALQAVHLDATDPFLGAVGRFPQCKDLDVMTFLRQGLGVTHHAVVGVIEGVRDHAHAQRLIEMAFRLPSRAGGQAVWFKQWYSDSGGFECGLGLGG